MAFRHLIRTTAAALIVSAATLIAPAVASAGQVRFYVRVGPPRPVVEHRIVAPGRGYVWVPGYYTYAGNQYVWTTGRWERPPRARARWVAPQWHHDKKHGWFFVQGRWR